MLTEHTGWNFFSFEKGEILTADGGEGRKPLKIGMSAKYISFGEQSAQMPGLASGKGYELYFPAGKRTMCCNIPMYGPYISVEDTELIDYYFKIVLYFIKIIVMF